MCEFTDCESLDETAVVLESWTGFDRRSDAEWPLALTSARDYGCLCLYLPQARRLQALFLHHFLILDLTLVFLHLFAKPLLLQSGLDLWSAERRNMFPVSSAGVWLMVISAHVSVASWKQTYSVQKFRSRDQAVQIIRQKNWSRDSSFYWPQCVCVFVCVCECACVRESRAVQRPLEGQVLKI